MWCLNLTHSPRLTLAVTDPLSVLALTRTRTPPPSQTTLPHPLTHTHTHAHFRVIGVRLAGVGRAPGSRLYCPGRAAPADREGGRDSDHKERERERKRRRKREGERERERWPDVIHLYRPLYGTFGSFLERLECGTLEERTKGEQLTLGEVKTCVCMDGRCGRWGCQG